jgi:hypothetical protein
MNRVIKVCTYTRPGRSNADLLPPQDRQRLVFVKNPYDAKYFITDMRWDREEYNPEEIVHKVQVEGVTIALVVRVVPSAPHLFAPGRDDSR